MVILKKLTTLLKLYCYKNNIIYRVFNNILLKYFLLQNECFDEIAELKQEMNVVLFV